MLYKETGEKLHGLNLISRVCGVSSQGEEKVEEEDQENVLARGYRLIEGC